MYGWYSKTQQNICERLEMETAARHFQKQNPYIYYIDKHDKHSFSDRGK